MSGSRYKLQIFYQTNFNDISTMYVQMAPMPEILDALADHDTLLLFYLIASEGILTSNTAIKELKITPKQYYSKLSSLTKSGIVEKENGKYSLTSLGIVVHEALQLIESGVNYYWKLKAIDSLRVGFSAEERNKIIEQLIDKRELSELVIRKFKEDRS
jgi:DNA-binding HxlR family transcriptional regulator